MRESVTDEAEGWEWELVVDQDRFSAHNDYYYKGTLCHRVTLQSPMANHCTGYRLIRKDLQYCRTWFSKIADIQTQDPAFNIDPKNVVYSQSAEQDYMKRALFVAGLTTYGKCFTEAKGRRIKLERPNIDSRFHQVHDDTLSHRHNYAAHSGEDTLEQSTMFLVLDAIENRQTFPLLRYELLQPSAYHKDNIYEVIELVDHLIEYVNKKIEVLEQKIKQEIFDKGIEYWYKLAQEQDCGD